MASIIDTCYDNGTGDIMEELKKRKTLYCIVDEDDVNPVED